MGGAVYDTLAIFLIPFFELVLLEKTYASESLYKLSIVA